jgi:hypothetical protein
MVSGTYFYLFAGAIVSGQSVAYAELGKLVTDGNGNYYGNAFGSGNGQQAADSFSGTYSVQPNSTGSMTGTGTATFQVVNNGQGMILAITTSNAFATGAADRQTAGATPIQCGNGSLSGAYGYLLTGVAPGGSPCLSPEPARGRAEVHAYHLNRWGFPDYRWGTPTFPSDFINAIYVPQQRTAPAAIPERAVA